MEGQDIRGLMEAYSQVYETPEVLNEEVVEEDVEQLMERGAPTDPKARAAYNAQVAKNRAALGNTLLYGNAAGKKPEAPVTRNRNVRGGGTIKPPAAAAPTKPAAAAPSKPAAAPAAAAPTKPAAAAPSKPAAAPAAAAPTKPASTATSKPSTPAAPAKPQGSAMDQWAKANPKLAAAKAERDRTRGTSATTNPLMKDMKSSLPAPKSPSPSTAKTGFDLAKKGVNLAAGADLFDLVKGHLLDEGYAETEEGAMVIMVNMSEEWRKSILESYGVELDENREHEREMRKAAARERAEEKKERKEEGKKSAKAPGRLGKSAGSSYADYQEVSIKAHDKATKGKFIPGMVKNEGYQRDPEKGEENEKEENKKYEKVRGEKTPMPPRGDKRREEFEKWYAKHVR